MAEPTEPKDPKEPTEPKDPKEPTEPKDPNKSARELALEETLQEMKTEMETLKKSNKYLQVSLEKMALQVGTKSPTDEDLFKDFSKYERR